MMIKYIYRYALFFILNRRCGISLLGVVLFFSCFFFPGGCGYSAKSLLRSNVRSIYIPIFDNDTFRRGYEFDLTREVRDQILMKTDLRIVDKEEADSILYGKISNINENVLIEDRRDNIVESRIKIKTSIRWVDTRSGRTIVEKKNIKSPAEFIIQRNETLTSARNEALVNTAQMIVEEMEEEWW